MLFFLCIAGSAVSKIWAQEFNDEMKKKLRQSLIVPEQKPLQYQPSPIKIRPQQNQEVLKVSPTTKLPTVYDRAVTNQVVKPEEISRVEKEIGEIAKRVDDASQPARAAINYSDGKVHPIPDGASRLQWAQHTRNDYDLGIYTDESSAEWLVRLRNRITPRYRNIDLDPVRTIQNIKARKRKEKVNKIKKAYGQSD